MTKAFSFSVASAVAVLAGASTSALGQTGACCTLLDLSCTDGVLETACDGTFFEGEACIGGSPCDDLSGAQRDLFNGGFEIPDVLFGPSSAEGWNFIAFEGGDPGPSGDFVLRRTATDAFTPANPLIRSGQASLMLRGGNVASAFLGAVLSNGGGGDIGAIDRRLGFESFGQEIRITGYFAVPADAPWQIISPSIQPEFRVSAQGDAFRIDGGATVAAQLNLIVPVSQGGTGHTNGEWRRFELVIDYWLIEQLLNRQLNGFAAPTGLPDQFDIIPFLFNGPSLLEETGVVYFDDFSYEFTNGDPETPGDPSPPATVWGDRQVNVQVEEDPSVTEAPIEVSFNAVDPVGPPLLLTGSTGIFASSFIETVDAAGGLSTPPNNLLAWNFDSDGLRGESWTTVNILDRVPGYDDPATGQFQFTTGWHGYPVTWSDVVVNGRLKARVQDDEGGTFNIAGATGSASPAGTVVVTAPSYEATTFDEPTYTSADVQARFLDTLDGAPADTRGEVEIDVAGTYPSGAATFTGTRDYNVDPVVGSTTSFYTYTFDVDSAITLTGEFRLATLESIFGVPGDSQSLVVSVNGTEVDLRDVTPGSTIFGTPVAFAVGETITVENATSPGLDAATGEDSADEAPTIALTLDALTGAAGALEVQGTLGVDGTAEVWVAWADAPGVLSTSTSIDATFTVTATEPTSCTSDLVAPLLATDAFDLASGLDGFDADGDGMFTVDDVNAVIAGVAAGCLP
ncbi:MAG: hypothetical protein AAGI30_03465 [Planctomycetota bacterium]